MYCPYKNVREILTDYMIYYNKMTNILEKDPKTPQNISQYMATEEQLKLLKSQGIIPEKYLQN